MAAVQTVLIPTPKYNGNAPASIPSEKVGELIHELRQPLSSIEAVAYYLEMTLPPEQVELRHYMRRVQQMVDHASATLEKAAMDIRKPVGRATAAGQL